MKAKVGKTRFDIVYVHGAHDYGTVKHDIGLYDLVTPDGFLVDAGFSLRGETFWKGRPGPSQAVDEIPGDKFVNVLNVGHNRVFRRRSGSPDLGAE